MHEPFVFLGILAIIETCCSQALPMNFPIFINYPSIYIVFYRACNNILDYYPSSLCIGFISLTLYPLFVSQLSRPLGGAVGRVLVP